MKKNKIVYAVLGAILPIAGMSIGICHLANYEKEEVDFHGIKAVPMENRYSNLDFKDEPQAKKTYSYNYAFMGMGGTTFENSTVWDNYRGETLDNKKVTVAVIDSGIDIYHEDFLKPSAKGVKLNKNNIEQYSIIDPKSCHIYDYTDDENTGSSTKTVRTEVGISHAYDEETYDIEEKEYYSHGTATASCIGAAINQMGGWGIAPNVNLLIINCDLYFTSMDVAIRYAADNGADVINMSVGAYAETFTDGFDIEQEGFLEVATLLQPAIDYAQSKDVVVVASAGNEDTYHKSYPACNKGVVGVGALSEDGADDSSYFSNFNGKNDTRSTENNVDVMAPGTVWTANVPQIDRFHSDLRLADSFYSSTSGTSFSSPLTAGAIALYRAKNPSATRQETIDALLNSCTDIGSVGWDSKFGFGRVNVEEFLTDPVKVSEIKINPNQVSLIRSNDNPYPTAQLEATFLPLDATEHYKRGLWMSENEDVAIVDENTGLVTAKGNGETKIHFITDMDLIDATCDVKVTGKVDFIETNETIKITPQNHKLTTGYGWKTWNSGGIKGESYVFGDTKDKLQFNTKKTSCYVFNETAIPGDITSITIKGSEKSWQVLTSPQPFKKVAGTPTEGNDGGTKVLTSNGVTFDISGKDNYFAICYKDSGAGYIYEIDINYKGLKLPDKTITLDKTSVFLKAGESTTLNYEANGDVIWTNSDPSVASFENGKITAIKEGTTIITAKNGDATAHCVVTVTPNYDLTSITLNKEIPTSIPFKGELDLSDIIVTANYSNNHPARVVEAEVNNIDTSILGKQILTFSYTENGITKTIEKEIFVTNVGAIRNESSSTSEVNKTITNKDNVFKTEKDSIVGDNNTTWNLNITKKGSGSVYVGWNGNDKGAQIGSNNSNIPTKIQISSANFIDKPIEKIVISTKSENAKLSVSVGNQKFKVGTKDIVNTSKSVNDYVFEGLAKGNVEITYTDLSKFTVLCRIEVYVKGGTSYSWSGDDQAASFINYLKQFRTCANDWENRDDIKTLVNEYNAMIQEAKNSKLLNSTFEDHGYSVNALTKLKAIVDEYNHSLKEGETALKLILSSTQNGIPVDVYETLNDSSFLVSHVDIIILISVAGLLITSLAIIFIVLNKHKAR